MTRHRWLWLVQLFLAVIFGAVGVLKTTLPLAELLRIFPWTGTAPGLFVRLLGAAELAASLGLVLPAATRIWPRLTALTAWALTGVMVLAVGLHGVRGEWDIVPVPLVVGALTLFVALGRS